MVRLPGVCLEARAVQGRLDRLWHAPKTLSPKCDGIVSRFTERGSLYQGANMNADGHRRLPSADKGLYVAYAPSTSHTEPATPCENCQPSMTWTDASMSWSASGSGTVLSCERKARAWSW